MVARSPAVKKALKKLTGGGGTKPSPKITPLKSLSAKELYDSGFITGKEYAAAKKKMTPQAIKRMEAEAKAKPKSEKLKQKSIEDNKKEQARLNKKDKKEGSPKMKAEKKAQGLSAGAKRKLKSKDTETIKKLERAAKSLGKDQKGAINRLMAEKQLGNFKGKQQMALATAPAKMADAAKETMMRLYKKLKTGSYSQKEFRDFEAAQRRVKDFMGRRGDTTLKAPKEVLMARFPEPNVVKEARDKDRLSKIKAVSEKLKSKRANKAKGGMGLKMPTADQVGLKKLPTEVRNKMGYMYGGGMAKKPRMGSMDYRKGGLLLVAINMMKKGKKGK